MNVALERANIISNDLEQTGTYSSTMYATLNQLRILYGYNLHRYSCNTTPSSILKVYML